MIVKIWGIKSLPHLSNSFEYNENEDKTKDINPYDIRQEINQTRNILSRKTLKSLFNYAVNPNKTTNTIGRKYVSGYRCSPQTAIEEFTISMDNYLENRGKNHTEKNNMAFHIVQSFPPGTELSNEEIHQCGAELCEKLGAYQAVICSHINPVTDENGKVHGVCKHNHIILNAYPWDLKCGKYHDCKKTYALLRKYNDEIAKAHNQSVIELKVNNSESKKSVYENIQIKNKCGWKEEMRKRIDAVKAVSTDWEGFKKHIQKAGISIREGKYITYTDENGHKARDKRLGTEYSKSGIEDYFKHNNELAEDISKNKASVSDNISANIIPSAPVFYTEKRAKNKNYKVRMRDKNGRKRSMIELIILLAVTVLKKDNGPKQTAEIKIYTDKRLQGMMDAIALARKEEISDKEILMKKLGETGKEISALRNIISKCGLAKKRMDSVNIAVDDYIKFRDEHKFLFDSGGEKMKFLNESERENYKEAIDKYTLLRGMLHSFGIHNERDIDNFKQRYDRIGADIERYKKGLAEQSQRYGRLKAVERNVILAEEITSSENMNKRDFVK